MDFARFLHQQKRKNDACATFPRSKSIEKISRTVILNDACATFPRSKSIEKFHGCVIFALLLVQKNLARPSTSEELSHD